MLVSQTRHGVGLERFGPKATFLLGAAIPQTDFRHTRLLREIEGNQVRKRANHRTGRRIDSTESSCLLHATGFLVIRGLWRDVVEAQNAAVQNVHHYRPKVIFFVINRDSEDWTRIQDSPDRSDYILEIGAWGAALHEEPIGDCVEAEQAIARASSGSEAGGDCGGEVLEGALVAAVTWGPLQKAPDVVINVEDRLADRKEARDEVANRGHARLCDMEVSVCGGIECFSVSCGFLLVRNEHMDSGGRDPIGLEYGEGFVAKGGRTTITWDRDDPIIRDSCAAGLPLRGHLLAAVANFRKPWCQ